jgi:hypothetical protein
LLSAPMSSLLCQDRTSLRGIKGIVYENREFFKAHSCEILKASI